MGSGSTLSDGSSTLTNGGPRAARGWPPYRTMWIFLLLGWTVSAADRALTGPVVTWMIDNDVGFLQSASNPHALGGLIGGLFFAGYMLTQWPGGYLGDRYGHRTVITISLVGGPRNAALGHRHRARPLHRGPRPHRPRRGGFYSNDRSLIAEKTPLEKRSLGMGVVITGLAIGITIAILATPELIKLGNTVFAGADAWRMAFLVLGAVTLVVGIAVAVYFRRQEPRLPDGRAALHMGAYAAGGLAAVMAVYFIGDSAGLSNLWIAVIEVALAVCLVMAVFARKGEELGAVIRNRDLWLINLAFIAVLWSLWFFSFWSVSIVADAAHSSFGRSALIAAFNAGAGILGFLPVGGWLSDVAARPRDRPPAARDRVHVHADAGDAGVRVRAPRQRAVGVADDRAAVQREHVLQRDAADGPGHARRHSRTPPTAARRLG